MASANWLKSTTQKAGAMKKHFGQKERETVNHSNQNIDTSLSKLNYAISCNDYSEALEHMKERTKEVDKIQPPKRIRKDRVTCCFIEIPCPDRLTQLGLSDDFFQSAFRTMQDFFGVENVHGGFVHKDERHEYTDKDGNKRMSLEHMHTLVSAYTIDKGINGKAFETKSRLRALNKALDDMCVKRFGFHLNTGETPERKSVERLKQETELRREADRLNDEITEKDNRLALYNSDEIAMTERIEKLQAEVNLAEEKIKVSLEAEARTVEAEKKAKTAEQRTAFAQNELEKVNAQHEVANKELKKVLDIKARASEKPTLKERFGGEYITYNKTMLDSTRAIGSEAYNELQKANQTMQQAVAIQQQAERKEQSIQPLYQQAQTAYRRAEQERKKQQELRENIEKLIEKRAKALAETLATDRIQRLESYCQQLKFSDGTTALDKFEELEQERQILEQLRKKSIGLSLD